MQMQQRWRTTPLNSWLMRRVSDVQPRLNLEFFAACAGLLIAFVVLDRILSSLLSLPTIAYLQGSLSLAGVQQLGVFVSIILLITVAIGWRFGALSSSWYELEAGRLWRNSAIVLAVLVAWPVITFGYNFYFDQWFIVERIIIVVLLCLSWRWPVFLLPLLFFLYVMYGQLVEPGLGGSVLAHKTQVLRALQLIGAAFCLHALTGYRKTHYLLFILCCFIATAYWVPAFAKHQLGWWSIEKSFYLPMAAYLNGWLGGLSQQGIVQFANHISTIDALLKATVLIGEGACLLLLLHRRLTLALLAGMVLFHIGVFVLMGFFFWTWIALDVVAFLLVKHSQSNVYRGISWPLRVLVSIGLIMTSAWWAKSPVLAWYDTPLSYTYQVSMVDGAGQTTTLHPAAFAPYEDVMAMASFAYLSPHHSVLLGPYGVTHNIELLKKLEAAREPADVFAIENSYPSTFKQARTDRFTQFLTAFAKNQNQGGDRNSLVRTFAPPPQFWNLNTFEKSVGKNNIKRMIVTEKTGFFSDNVWRLIRSERVLTIDIEAQQQE